MGNIMILAESVPEGERYAKAHDLDPRGVITPMATDRARGRSFDDYVIVGAPRLNEAEWASVVPTLLGAGEEVLDRFFYEAQGKLPPPIELERENIPRF